MQTQVYSIDEIREIVAPIAKQHGVDKVFLFGSYARGDATPFLWKRRPDLSDLDQSDLQWN